MKSIMINDIVYSVGDEVYMIPKDKAICIREINSFKKCKIIKITSSGYVYVKVVFPIDIYMPCDIRINKDGTSGKYILTPYSELLESKINELWEKKRYIQNTFKRMKLITTLSYTKAEKLNSLLDEIGIYKVE